MMNENIIKSIYEFPQYYDVTSPGSFGDLEFYLDQIRNNKGQVLEIGSGTGRILIPVAKAGYKITGIDNSGPMLCVANHKVSLLQESVQNNISLLNLDMRNLNLDGKYRIVLMPYRVFMHLYSASEQLMVLNNIHKLIQNNGVLIISIFDPDVRTLADFVNNTNDNYRILREGQLESDKSLVSWATTRIDLENQLIEEIWTYKEIQNSNVINESVGLFRIRYTYKYEMEHLLNLSGFVVNNLYGDFDYSTYRYGKEQIWVCSKK